MGEGAGHQPCNDDALDLDKRVPWEKEGRKRGRVWKGGRGGRVVEGRKRGRCGREEAGEVWKGGRGGRVWKGGSGGGVEGRKRGRCGREEAGEVWKGGRGERVVEEEKVVEKKLVYVNRWAVENQEIMVLSFLT